VGSRVDRHSGFGANDYRRTPGEQSASLGTRGNFFDLLFIAAYRTWKGATLNPLIRKADSFIDIIAELRFTYKDSDSVRRPFSSRSVPLEIKEEQHKELIRLFALVEKHIEEVEHLSLCSEFMTRFKDQNGRNMDAHEAVTLLKDHKEVLVRKKRALI